MIERLYIKELLSFDEVALEFEPGLIVLTGPSGAGKSVLMQSVLSSFGYGSSEARACEVSISRPPRLTTELFDLEDELVVKSLKKDRVRFYLNEQNISKKALGELFGSFVNFLSVRDKTGFEPETLLGLLDRSLKNRDKSYNKLLKEYEKRYAVYLLKQAQLQKILDDEKKLAELIEFTTFEIEKIKSVNPKVGEDEELLKIKQQLSRIDKINDALTQASEIFNHEASVWEVFRLLDKDASFFSDTMNHLRAEFDEAESLAEELADIDVEEVLERLEQIAGLKRRYGSIEEALAYKEKKERELASYEVIEKDKSMLESFLSLEFAELMTLAQRISRMRQQEAKSVEKSLKNYLSDLKLPSVQFAFAEKELSESGIDSVDLMMGTSTTSTLSGGELNRLRLALMVVVMEGGEKGKGVIILDEIDANVSGDESIAIAEMIAKLSNAYQIFAISHQPHLSAKADQHILITKEDGASQAKVLGEDERIAEISRIIAGENSEMEAVAFAKTLRGRR